MTPSPLKSLRRRSPAMTLAAVATTAVVIAGCGSSSKHTTTTSGGNTSPATTSGGYTSHVFASGIPISITTPAGKVPVSQPDDITMLNGNIYVAFQNQVGPQGEPAPKGVQGAGNKESAVVEFSGSGSVIRQWQVLGHVDGLTADPAKGQVAVSSNEDANAHIFLITPSSTTAVSYTVPKLPHGGGMDAISFYQGKMLVSASAPGTVGKPAPQASYPAIYQVTLNSGTHAASVTGLFSDEATAQKANSGQSGSTKLQLVDPDSNAVVPSYAQRYGGQFELTSQGDYQQIFTPNPAGKQLTVLKLTQSIDDSAWTTPSGTLYVTDGSADLIYKITGPFPAGGEIVGVTPCDAGNAPASCPQLPKFPSNYLGVVDESTGAVSKFPMTSPSVNPAGLMFVK